MPFFKLTDKTYNSYLKEASNGSLRFMATEGWMLRTCLLWFKKCWVVWGDNVTHWQLTMPIWSHSASFSIPQSTTAFSKQIHFCLWLWGRLMNEWQPQDFHLNPDFFDHDEVVNILDEEEQRDRFIACQECGFMLLTSAKEFAYRIKLLSQLLMRNRFA